MTVLILGLVLFLGIHAVQIVAPGFREATIARIGDGPWKGLYSLVSLAGLLLIGWGYGMAHVEAPVLYEPPRWLKHTSVLLMFFASLAIAVYALPAGRLKPALGHPMLLAIILWGAAHVLANGDLASLLIFASFLVWAVLDRISVGRRDVRPPAPGPYLYDFAALALGLAIFVAFLWRLHLWLFGVSPLG